MGETAGQRIKVISPLSDCRRPLRTKHCEVTCGRTLLETDGDLSQYLYPAEVTRPGLSVLPAEHRPEYSSPPAAGLYSCGGCGFATYHEAEDTRCCKRCGHGVWSPALDALPSR